MIIAAFFFDISGYSVDTFLDSLDCTVGESLLEPHINYTNHVLCTLNTNEPVKGIAHITGGGLTENIPRILPRGCSVNIKRGAWPNLPVFDTIEELGNIEVEEMYRAFNMGIGMVFIVDKKSVDTITKSLKNITPVFNIGTIVKGEGPPQTQRKKSY